MKRPPSINSILNAPELSEFISKYGRGLALHSARHITELIRSGEIEEDAVSATINYIKKLVSPPYPLNATGDPLQEIFSQTYKIPLNDEEIEASVKSRDELKDLFLEGLYDYKLNIYPNLATAVRNTLHSLKNNQPVAIATTNCIDFKDISFPDFLTDMGFEVFEVGTSNRVHLYDYEEAIKAGARTILIVSSPGFEVEGFTTQPDITEIKKITSEEVIVLVILDNATFTRLSPDIIPHRYSAEHYLENDCDLVITRGEGLMAVGRSGLVFISERCKKSLNDLNYFEGFRPDIASETEILLRLFKYLNEDVLFDEHPVLEMLTIDDDHLAKKANSLKDRLMELGLEIEMKPCEKFVCGKVRKSYNISIIGGPSPEDFENMKVIMNQPLMDVFTLSDEDIDEIINRLKELL